MNRDTCAFVVRVENIPKGAKVCDVTSVFRNLIGDVHCSEERHIAFNGGHLELSFSTYDNFKKALCMSGYNILGMPLIVTPVIGPKPFQGNSKEVDSRRNLYVLGLPFDLSKAEFANMFSRYGTVTHTVILATVDNASRRRGFVVMSTHEEAKRVISSMSRTQIKGHTIDISWAVVQRSQGFLDGEDRSMMLASPLSSTLSDVDACFSSFPALPTNEGDKCSNTTFVPTARLLVTHLPFLLFSQQSDLHPLFCPFGEIKSMKLLDRSLSERQANTVSAVVEYAMVSSAREAKETLQTQSYTDLPVDVRYMQDTFSAIGNVYAPLHPGHLCTENKISTFGLNPFATPFVLNECPSFAAAPPFPTNQDNQTRSAHQMDNFISSGLPGNTHNVFSFASPYLTSDLAYHLSQANTISRSSSATSSSWSTDSRQAIPPRPLNIFGNRVRAPSTLSYAFNA